MNGRLKKHEGIQGTLAQINKKLFQETLCDDI